jgi:hypothetical protein
VDLDLVLEVSFEETTSEQLVGATREQGMSQPGTLEFSAGTRLGHEWLHPVYETGPACD